MHRLARWTALVSTGGVLLLASAALLAWVTLVDDSWSTPLPIPPGAAACFLALGAGLLALNVRPRARSRWDVLLLGGLTVVFAALALLEAVHRLPVSMSWLFAAERGDVLQAVALRMNPGTALGFVLAGLALAGLATRWRTAAPPLVVQGLLAMPLASGFVGLLDATLRALHLLRSTDYQGLPVLASVGFVLFCVAHAATAEVLSPGASLLFQSGVGGRLVRRVLPGALAMLGGSTALGLLAVDHARITPSAALSLLLFVNGVSLCGLLALSASHLVRPLRALQSCLEQGSVRAPQKAAGAARPELPPEVVRTLRDARCEFGDFARLLEAFMRQQQALLAENAERRRAEEALGISDAKHRRLLEVFPRALVVFEAGKLSFANPAAARLFGLGAAAELIDTYLVDRVCKGDKGRLEQRLEQVAQCGVETRLEVYMERRGGEEFLAEVEAQRLGAQHEGALQLALTDIGGRERERQLLETHTRRLELLLRKTAALFETPGLVPRLQLVTESLRALGWLRARIHVLDADMRTVELVVAGCTPDEELQLRVAPLSAASWRRELDPQSAAEPIGNFWFVPTAFAASANAEALLFAPLLGPGGETIGMLVLQDSIAPLPPSPECLEPLELFVQLAASCIVQERRAGEPTSHPESTI